MIASPVRHEMLSLLQEGAFPSYASYDSKGRRSSQGRPKHISGGSRDSGKQITRGDHPYYSTEYLLSLMLTQEQRSLSYQRHHTK